MAPNYSVNVNMQNRQSDPMATGLRIGKAIGSIGSAVAGGINTYNKAEDTKKADQLLLEYNQGSGVFAGMTPSMKASKMSRLLAPIDAEKSKRFLEESSILEKRELQNAQNQSIASAYNSGTNEEEKYRAGAQEYLKYDPQSALNMMAKADALGDKRESREELKKEQEFAISTYENAVANWQKNKDGNAEQQAVLGAIANAKTSKLSLENPIDNWINEKQFASNTEIKKDEVLDKKAQRAKEDERWAKSFELEAKKFYADQAQKNKAYDLAKKKADQESSKEASGTEGENKAVGFASRMTEASKIMSSVAPNLSKAELFAIASGSNMAISFSEDAQRYQRALEDYVRANLRMESGAVISQDEMDGGFSQYGISPLDSEATKKDKFNRVALGIQAMRSSAGKKVGNVDKLTGGKYGVNLSKGEMPKNAPVNTSKANGNEDF